MASKANVENSLRCSVCLDYFKDPKVLPCFHTFCKKCLEKIQSKGDAKGGISEPGEPPANHSANDQCDATHNEEVIVVILTCPQCRAQHKLTGGGVEGLLTDYTIEDELDKIKSSSCQEENIKSSLRCGLCESTDPVVSFCNDCSLPLCEFCQKAHQRLKPYYGHGVKSIDKVDSQLLSKREIKHASHLVCSKHPTQVPQIFCSSCDELICCECVIEGHKGHEFVGVNSETRLAMEKKLSDTSSSVCAVLEVFKKDLEYVESVEKATNSTGMKNQADIKKMFDEFISILQNRRDDLLAKSEEKNNAKLKLIWSEKDFLEQMVTKLTATLSFSERLQTCKNDGEYLSLSSQALLSLRELEHKHWDRKSVEENDLYYLRPQKKANEPAVFLTAANFDGKRHQILKLEWKTFPTQINLGEKHVGTICVTRDDTEHSYVLYNVPSVTVRHNSSLSCHVAEISINRSAASPGTWDVTFTPYCGGNHICEVVTDRAITLIKSFDVVGVPSKDSVMMKGPSWNYCGINHAYGESKTDLGKVIRYNAGEKRLHIQWPDGNRFQYRWGASDMFDVQLHHVVPL